MTQTGKRSARCWLLGSWAALWLTACTASEAPVRPAVWSGQLALLVSANDADATRDAVASLEAQLRALAGVEAVHGARGNARLFFGERWPLYLSVEQLQQLSVQVRTVALGDPKLLLRRLLLPQALEHWQRANLLYAASMPYASTPDEREIAVLIRMRPGAEAEVRSQVRALRPTLGRGVNVSLDDPGAQALLFGSPGALRVVTSAPARVREIVSKLDQLRRRDATFAIREARHLESYLPGDAAAQLAASAGLHAFLTSDQVSGWSQLRRDAVRALLPVALHRVPSQRDLPEYVQALFRAADADPDRTLILLPRAGLDPRLPAHRRRVRAALTQLGITEPVEGLSADELAPKSGLSPHWLLSLMILLGLLAWRWPSPRTSGARLVRRAVLVACAMLAVSILLSQLALSLARDWLRSEVPQLRLGSLQLSLPGSLEATQLQFSWGTNAFEIEQARLLPVGPGTLALRARGVTAHIVQPIDGIEIREELALGDVSLDASLDRHPELQRVVVTGGDAAVALDRQRARGPGLTGTIRLTPQLFGRLPLLAEAPDILGFSARSSAPQLWHLTPDWAVTRP